MAPRGKELTSEQNQIILSLHGKKLNGRHIANLLGLSRATVQKFVKRYR